MPRLSWAQELVRRQIADLAWGGLLPDELAGRLLLALQQAIPADVRQMFGIDPGSLLFNRLMAVDRAGTSRTLDWVRASYSVGQADLGSATPGLLHAGLWLRTVYLADDFDARTGAALTFPDLMRAGLTAVAIHDRPETSWGVPPRLFRKAPGAGYSRAYHATGNPPGGGIRACFAAGGQWIAALQLARFDPGRPFRPTDVAFLRLVAPTIGRAMRAACARERAIADAATAGPDATGVLVLSASGGVRFWTPAAETWLRLLRDTREPEAPHRTQLPTAIWSAVAQLRAGMEENGPPVVRVPTPAGTLRVEASPGGEDGFVAVVLARERPPALPNLPPDWPLTPRERQVLALVAGGLSNRRVAASLRLSEHTVESHLAHAYDKLDVHSRSQFLGRLFRETVWPTQQDSSSADPPA